LSTNSKDFENYAGMKVEEYYKILEESSTKIDSIRKWHNRVVLISIILILIICSIFHTLFKVDQSKLPLEIGYSMLTIYIAVLGFIFTIATFYINTLEIKRQHLVSLTKKSNEYMSELSEKLIPVYRGVGTSFQRLVFCILIAYIIPICSLFLFIAFYGFNYFVTALLYYLSLYFVLLFVLDVALIGYIVLKLHPIF
jgi:hypothetical protein